MKISLTYGSSYEIVISTKTAEVYRYNIDNAVLQVAVDFVESVFADETALHSELISEALICDAHTGEILAECVPDSDYEESDFENENYDSGWWYNEDMGYDPYMGCYTDDC